VVPCNCKTLSPQKLTSVRFLKFQWSYAIYFIPMSFKEIKYLFIASIMMIFQVVFYDRMTMHRNRFFMNKTNRCTKFQFCVSRSLSAHHQEFLAVHRLWYILCSCDEPFATRSRMELPTCFGQPFCPSSGVLSRTSALVHFMQLWWTVCYQE
jgi:hypothetical protein